MRQITGSILPGRQGYVEVYFEPQFGGSVKWNLIFSIALNDEEFILPVEGVGLLPSIKLTPHEIMFDPTLPYINNYGKSFCVENKSRFPVEFFFSDYDL